MLKGFVVLCLLLSNLPASAQGRLLLDEAQARKNLVVAKPPVAPAGHRTGRVVLLVEISPEGKVSSAKPDSGPSFLRDAAVDAVRQWRFKPFTAHGEKVPASTKLTVDFGEPTGLASPPPLPSTPAPVAPAADDALQQFQALTAKCHALVNAQAEPAQQAASCRAAADQAATLKGADRFVLQRSADVFAATALMRTDDLKLAVAYGSKAIKAATDGHDDDAGLAAAYAVRGQARAFAGDLRGADLDLGQAEAAEGKALVAAAGKPVEPEARTAMKNLLLFHAKLLTALKQPDKAAAKTAEAGRL